MTKASDPQRAGRVSTYLFQEVDIFVQSQAEVWRSSNRALETAKRPLFRYAIFGPLAYSKWSDTGRVGRAAVRSRILASLFLITTSLGGCGLFPMSGPATIDIWVNQGHQDPKSLPYALVRVTPKITSVLGKAAPRLTSFGDRRRPKDLRFGVGDIVSVTIFEAASGGLFIPAEAGVRPGNFITIPNKAVDVNGNISIP